MGFVVDDDFVHVSYGNNNNNNNIDNNNNNNNNNTNAQNNWKTISKQQIKQ